MRGILEWEDVPWSGYTSFAGRARGYPSPMARGAHVIERASARRIPSPAESVWLRAAGFRLHARVSTAAPVSALPVVFVHGVGVASTYMLPTLVRVAPQHRGYAPDLPGFGASEKPGRTLGLGELADVLAAWMDAAALERAAVVGNSVGCQVVLELALRHGGRTACLVLLGPTIDPAARSPRALLWRWLLNARHEPARLLPVLLRDYRAAGIWRPLRTLAAALRDPVEQKLPRIETPALVLRGEHDALVSQAWAERVAELLPRGRLAVVPGAAHTVNFNAAEPTARLITAFLAGTA